ncbi:aminotransferase class I/II-fold pyridoxal phosphate-dependent enzyme [Pelagibius sp. Alg239-R121]|uniref:aminotransferase class I/II-fold pyridoxal phosphate-dependent enzyme n=1 Tax=Pelagibius sp. Alg239-R121 TaxID=2993448 RepID=UPI0024A7388F|nr:aminotransferase class I/II-fold pyridoxal phosphate-dependent enzyme [Pelagibius sp. Alg239-R121]
MRNFELETYFSKWEFTAKHHMTASDVQSMSIGALCGLAGIPEANVFKDLWLGYTETWGAPDLRTAIAATYDRMAPENILCFAGAEEGVYAAMRVLLTRDDHVIVVVPNYQAAETIPLDICDVTGVPLDPDNGWRLDVDDIRQAIRPNTKLVSVNFPNNPTGAVMPKEDYAELIALCREHGLYLFNDEVYRMLELDETKCLPQAADAYEKGLSLGVMSKAYGLPGLRIGWIASQDTDALLKLERYKHYLSICNSAPSERLAVIALTVRDKILERNRTLLRRNLAALDRFFADYPSMFNWRHPDGGCIGFPRYRGQGDVEAFCTALIEESGVLLLPASIYRSELMETPADRFRIGFGREGIEVGLDAFREFLDRNHNTLSV